MLIINPCPILAISHSVLAKNCHLTTKIPLSISHPLPYLPGYLFRFSLVFLSPSEKQYCFFKHHRRFLQILYTRAYLAGNVEVPHQCVFWQCCFSRQHRIISNTELRIVKFRYQPEYDSEFNEFLLSVERPSLCLAISSFIRKEFWFRMIRWCDRIALRRLRVWSVFSMICVVIITYY